LEDNKCGSVAKGERIILWLRKPNVTIKKTYFIPASATDLPCNKPHFIPVSSADLHCGISLMTLIQFYSWLTRTTSVPNSVKTCMSN